MWLFKKKPPVVPPAPNYRFGIKAVVYLRNKQSFDVSLESGIGEKRTDKMTKLETDYQSFIENQFKKKKYVEVNHGIFRSDFVSCILWRQTMYLVE